MTKPNHKIDNRFILFIITTPLQSIAEVVDCFVSLFIGVKRLARVAGCIAWVAGQSIMGRVPEPMVKCIHRLAGVQYTIVQ